MSRATVSDAGVDRVAIKNVLNTIAEITTAHLREITFETEWNRGYSSSSSSSNSGASGSRSGRRAPATGVEAVKL